MNQIHFVMKSSYPKAGQSYAITGTQVVQKTSHANFWTGTVTAQKGKKTMSLGINCSEEPKIGQTYASFKLKPDVFIEEFGAKFIPGVIMLKPAVFK